MKRRWVLSSARATERLGRTLARTLHGGEVIALVGPLGAGKTTLTRGLAAGLGLDPHVVTSPTFVLVQRYPGRLPLVHIDLYRVASKNDLDALGLDEWFGAPAADAVTVMEWADRFPELLRRSNYLIRLTFPAQSRRGSPIRGRKAEVTEPSGSPSARPPAHRER